VKSNRIVAVERDNHSYAHVKHVRDLAKKFVRELEEFFVNYHDLAGKKCQIIDVDCSERRQAPHWGRNTSAEAHNTLICARRRHWVPHSFQHLHST
jgi:inorganic pyrophosphatase